MLYDRPAHPETFQKPRSGSVSDLTAVAPNVEEILGKSGPHHPTRAVLFRI